jgi:uncharacterized membrane protein SpoIIM required for sporulation
MRETSFIKQNKEKWREFEQILEEKRRDPEKLNDLFIQITDDLSYSRTFYPNRSVRVYLNDLAQRIFFSLYRTRRSPVNRLIYFWTDELPQLMWESRAAMRFSFWAFVFAFLIGAISCAKDSEFAGVILGENYVAMTLENIERGDPMAVYKARGRLGMSVGITVNNLFVAFLTFVMGALFMVGAAVILIQNAIMVGAFQYFFIEQGLFLESFLTIWVHGTLEISAIILAAGAGLTMGKGLVFPETYTRLQAFQRSARRGVKIMIGIAPIFIMAGFIEGYLTRQTEAPDFARGLFILLSLLFVLWYFAWFPRAKAARGFESPVKDAHIPPDSALRVDFSRIKSSGEIFSEVFLLMKKHVGKAIGIASLGAASYTAAVFAFFSGPADSLFSFPNTFMGTLSVIRQFFYHAEAPHIPLVNLAVYAALAATIYGLLLREYEPGRPWNLRIWLIDWVKALGGAALLQLSLWPSGFLAVLIFLLCVFIPMLWMFVMQAERKNPWEAARATYELLRHAYIRSFGLFLTLSLVGLLFFTILDTGILWLYLDLVNWIVLLEADLMNQLSVLLLTFITMFILHLIVSMLFLGVGLLYFTLREMRYAPELLRRVRQLGAAQYLRGMEKEKEN